MKKAKRFSLRDAKNIAFTRPDEYSKKLKLFEKYKRVVDQGLRSYAPKSISLKSYEFGFVKRFIKENNISPADLIKFFFYEAGAYTDVDLAVLMNQKTSTSFLNFNPARWTYRSREVETPTGEMKDANDLPFAFHQVEYTSTPGSRNTLSFNLHLFHDDIIQEFLDNSDYAGLSAFVKEKLIEYGIYPSAMREVIAKDIVRKSEKKVKGRSANAGGTLSVNLSAYEDKLFQNLYEAAKELTPSIADNRSRLIKYALVDIGLIGDMKQHPLDQAKASLDELRRSFDPIMNYETMALEDRADEEVERVKYLETKDLKVGLALTFTPLDFVRMKKYIKELNASDENVVRDFMKRHGKKGKIYFTDLVRALIFDEYFHIYPNKMILNICLFPPK